MKGFCLTMRNVHFKTSLVVFFISITCAGLVFAGQAQQPSQPATVQTDTTASAGGTSASQILDRIIGREALMATKMRNMHPVVETYIQNLDKDNELAFRPVNDTYFLGKLDFKA